ncbi:hypothetical protein Dsin_017184 [Dipteronia sinensis]|uniref:Uncharacterized protein n=1 Tax=Dipteronia sinensis TaxID=43782 RepID=A0AAE0AFB2_9ROSI|nr:hypothetical protein Dsin_017184 [Dipteronia sinensis]
MIISSDKGVDYGSGNAGMRPEKNKPPLNGRAGAGAAAAEAGPLMGAHMVGSSANPNSSTTTPNHTTAPICPIFTRGTSSNGFVSQPHGVNDHYKHYNSYMNRNGGTHHPLGAGSSHHHLGRFMRHPPPPPPPQGSTPFIPPGPFVSPIGFLGADNLYYVAPPPPDAVT